MRNAGPYRIGLDIGGTFTDLVLMHDPSGKLWGHKILTTPADPAQAALRGVRDICGQAGIGLAEVGTVIHATTLVTNAIIERTGAKTVLLASEGFRDILEIGREQRYDIYDLFLRFPEPLVPRRWRMEVRERVTRDGEVRTPLDPAAVTAQISGLAASGIEAIAVCFLHAYKNPIHERMVRDLLARDFPHLAISVSSEVAPEIREYERTSTTVCNAYVQPLVARYLERLEAALGADGFAGRFLLMLSSGTLTTPEVARRFPVRLLESGPAAGALVAGYLGREAGHTDVVGFDMGGTTAKVCLVHNGRPAVAPQLEIARVHRFRKGSGLPIVAPVVDMIEIGAGGGSLARVDDLGLLRVGPQSAGADPGPACYGFGGTQATVTDACVALGYFDPRAFLGGAMPLDPAAAWAALARAGEPLGLDIVQTAWGIFAIVCESMAQAARLYLIERGRDPRRFAVMGFGGAGPATAARLARLLGVREVMIPPACGLASALGLLVAPLGFDFGRSLAGELEELDWSAVEHLYTELESRGASMVAGAGASAQRTRSERRAEMRYVGQFHDIEVAVPTPLGPDAAVVLRQRFDAAYAALYGVTLPGYPVQALNWRVLVTEPVPPASLRGLEEARDLPVRGKAPRQAYIPEAGGFVEVPVYDRYRLPSDAVVTGPAIVEEAEATTVLWPGDRLTVDAQHNLIIHVDITSPVQVGSSTGAPR
ncbi:MAG: hydantoinase/oxoprolinase family protein [Armatimonadota bacterium]